MSYEIVVAGTQRILAQLPPDVAAEIRLDLTDDNPAYKQAVAQGKDASGIKPHIISWREIGGYLHVPRYYKHPYLDKLGKARITPKAGDFKLNMKYGPRPNQVGVVQQIQETQGDFGLCLPCGFGKTYLSLLAASLNKGRVLIIAPTQVKLDEWREEIRKHTDIDAQGLTVGHIQASKREWEAHPIVVSMLNTVAAQDFPVELLNGFATVIVDEVHLCSAPVMSQALGRFNGRLILLSATPGSGVRRRVIELHGGNYWIREKAAGANTTVYFMSVPVPEFVNGLEWDKQKLVLTKNKAYSQCAAALARSALEDGRRVMILNSQIEPLYYIYKALQRGGFVIGEQSLLKRAETDAGLMAKIDSMAPMGSAATKAKLYVKDAKAHANPILATGLTKKQPGGVGMDVPDLDGGVIMFPVPDPDMTEQLAGRWNRVHPTKKDPQIVVMVPNTSVGWRLADRMASKLQSLNIKVVTRMNK